MLKNMSNNSHLFTFVYKMFHGNFREKNHPVVPDFSCVSSVSSVGFLASVVLDFLLLASDHRSMSNPTPLNMSICDAEKR